jgi:hypothetical protein
MRAQCERFHIHVPVNILWFVCGIKHLCVIKKLNKTHHWVIYTSHPVMKLFLCQILTHFHSLHYVNCFCYFKVNNTGTNHNCMSQSEQLHTWSRLLWELWSLWCSAHCPGICFSSQSLQPSLLVWRILNHHCMVDQQLTFNTHCGPTNCHQCAITITVHQIFGLSPQHSLWSNTLPSPPSWPLVNQNSPIVDCWVTQQHWALWSHLQSGCCGHICNLGIDCGHMCNVGIVVTSTNHPLGMTLTAMCQCSYLPWVVCTHCGSNVVCCHSCGSHDKQWPSSWTAPDPPFYGMAWKCSHVPRLSVISFWFLACWENTQ